jgi:hypothetical protein
MQKRASKSFVPDPGAELKANVQKMVECDTTRGAKKRTET